MYLSFLTILTANILTSLLHLNLKKTGKLPFLDVKVSRSNGKFSTSVYRKPTFTGLFNNFHSFIPLAYKRSFVSCLLHRIFNLCSSYENFLVRKLLHLNDFPSHMFHGLVRRFLNNIFEPKPTVHTVSQKIVYFCLPFTGSHSREIHNQITRLCDAASPHLNIRYVFRSSTRTSSLYLSFKDKVRKFMRSGAGCSKPV